MSKRNEQQGNKCDICPGAESKHAASIDDTNFRSPLSTVVGRSLIQIQQYKRQISTANRNKEQNYDIPFGKTCQQLLKKRNKENLLNLIIQLDGVGLVKSTSLKMWVCSASVMKLPPNIRSRRHNMPLLSTYIGHTESNAKLWLSSCFGMLKNVKREDMIRSFEL
ncbi:unnamed protein product [Didymodactylos carnosus]|uniref:Uncharacterized protein n=1 Tax=Didymodactylos carnosus TaxID=1234261 RepID=A0A814KJL5_9BILA|nr:unnamed protein product [Didymodactylos carnosus]CAF3821654.1 unnamed protein product [Didymodactylos carnosus]